MFKYLSLTLGLSSFTFGAIAAQSFYCPQHAGYIKVGMSQTQVLAACGEPLSKQESNQPATERVAVQQLLYNNEGSQTAFYGVWSLPVGTNGGAQLEIDVINNKVSAIRINGSDSNAFSICGGASIETGDSVGAVYSACGNPALVNHTFINQPIQSNQKPVKWIYQPGQYQSPITLTFVNEQLQSID